MSGPMFWILQACLLFMAVRMFAFLLGWWPL